ncbi:MAG: hypothetical protein COU33_03400 [Candidatus Magasanikbacteria bacterium CG10_big_fil_rev_8_21_14_0_10_43_6]|uniref:Uncharacterized protein n=1 Tax=Candidatus Magasanikbacteria bacterium CG10_big_fil_rev_8_21_14_0_10_43_6 TaxID=1974650 RepID=A0A2M6W0R4_9BACT|nr:MAG: hypothetical protein COU33_03400 [Candidatus Magasanikbacteria bacterium CG10_big_fil_rev_8_21_14_0_10_43_6]
MNITKNRHTIHQRRGVEYKHIESLRILYIIISGGITLSIGLIVFFIYSNVYQALEDANTIIILRSELGIETIDFDKLETVRAACTGKCIAPLGPLTRDPFSDVMVSPQTSTTPAVAETDI